MASVEDIEVVGLAGDYEELLAVADEKAPHVVVTDIRMPPRFEREGIDEAKDVKKRWPDPLRSVHP